MKRLFGFIVLVTALGCSKKADPDPASLFTCFLDRQVEAGVTTAFTYSDQGTLTSYTKSTGGGSSGELHAFTYDPTGRVTKENVTVSPSFSYAYNFTYGSDGKVSQYTYVTNGTEAGVYIYTRSDNTVTESLIPSGQSGTSETREFTYFGDNVTKEVLKEFYGPNNALSSVSTTERSDFGGSFSSSYTFYLRVKGLPFAHSKNNPGKEKVTTYSVVNGVNQPASTTNYTYIYTYNKSSAVLTREVSISGGTPTVDTYFYSGCD